MKTVCKKIAYQNELAAQEALERIKKECGHKRTERRVYKCSECRNFHLTSKTANNTKGLDAEVINHLVLDIMRLKDIGYDVSNPHPQLNSPVRRVNIQGETWRAYDLNVNGNKWEYIRTKQKGSYTDAVSFILKVLPID